MKNINMKSLLVVLALVVSGGVAKASDTKFSGHFDAELNYQLSNSVTGTAPWLGNPPTVPTTADATKGFAVGDASIKATQEMDNVTVNVDIPFSVRGGALSFGSKDQWYLKHNASTMFSWQAGKFDRIYGFEDNDSDMRTFLMTGIITSQANTILGGGASHLGATADLNFDPIKLTILFGNDGAALRGVSKPQYGAKLGFGGKDGLRLEASFIAQSQGSSLLDVVFGLPLGNLALDIEWIMGMNAGTTAPMGFAGYFTYGFTDSLDLGLRGEYSLNQGGVSGNNVLGITAGPQYKLGKKTTVKADIMFASLSGTSTGSEFSASVGAVQKF